MSADRQFNEYAAWLAAGISPELLGASAPADCFISGRGEAKNPGVSSDPVWKHPEHYIRVNGVPVLVEIDDTFDVPSYVVHGTCPTCFDVHESEDCCHWSGDLVGDVDVLRCDCSGEVFTLHYGMAYKIAEVK